ncbi:MAG TPA: F0F1 ATP synthase subunit A [Candidatus Eisenbacteria bacterium]|nr:F0F1 ATP synthase subunit A [Candidatus Eisenbacteria bacterium]
MEHHPFTWFGTVAHLHGAWEHVAGASLVVLVLLLFGIRVRSGLANTERAIAPEDGVTARNVAETFVEAIIGLAKSAIPHHAEHYVPLLATFFAFILLSNVLGLVPGFAPPTSTFNITFALGCVSFGAYHAYGVKAQGLGKYLKHFLGPVAFIAPLMLVIELFSHAFRPVSLGVRLYANMFADHTVIEIFTDLTKALIPVAFYALGFFVCIVQSFVFTMLSAIYISGAVAHGAEHVEEL